MAFRRNVLPLSLVPSSPKDFVDWLDLTMEAQQNFDTSETIWPAFYKILIHKQGNTLNKVQFIIRVKLILIHVTAPRCHYRGILEQSNTSKHVNPGITLAVLEGLNVKILRYIKIYKNPISLSAIYIFFIYYKILKCIQIYKRW